MTENKIVHFDELDPVSQVLVGKMCEIVGADPLKLNYGPNNNIKDNWYMQYSWTEQQEKEFIKWCVKELSTNKTLRKHVKLYIRNKHYLEKSVRFWVFNHGWRTEYSTDKSSNENQKQDENRSS